MTTRVSGRDALRARLAKIDRAGRQQLREAWIVERGKSRLLCVGGTVAAEQVARAYREADVEFELLVGPERSGETEFVKVDPGLQGDVVHVPVQGLSLHARAEEIIAERGLDYDSAGYVRALDMAQDEQGTPTETTGVTGLGMMARANQLLEAKGITDPTREELSAALAQASAEGIALTT